MRWLAYSNLFIALAAACAVHETYHLLDVEPRWGGVSALVFCATLLVYNLDRLLDAPDRRDDWSERHRWVEEHRRWLWGMAAVGGMGVVVSLAFVSRTVWMALIPLGMAAVGYTLPLVRGGEGGDRLKDLPGLKIVLIAGVWAGATALLPAIEVRGWNIDTEALWIGGERALFIFALCVPFDVRDAARDRRAGVQTLAHLLGERRALQLGTAAMVAFGLLCVWRYGLAADAAGPPLLASALLSAVAVARGHARRHPLYFVGLLDGMILLKWVAVVGWLD
ncbi:MAG: UbiA family prenyltransferase [Bradymonadaceae bacterium]